MTSKRTLWDRLINGRAATSFHGWIVSKEMNWEYKKYPVGYEGKRKRHWLWGRILHLMYTLGYIPF